MENKKLLYVEWADAVSVDGWLRTDFELEPAKCISVGFLIKENDKYLTICQGYSDADCQNGMFTIPKGWIKKRKFIKL